MGDADRGGFMPPHHGFRQFLVVRVFEIEEVGGLATMEGQDEVRFRDEPVVADDSDSRARQSDSDKVLPPVRGAALLRPMITTA